MRELKIVFSALAGISTIFWTLQLLKAASLLWMPKPVAVTAEAIEAAMRRDMFNSHLVIGTFFYSALSWLLSYGLWKSAVKGGRRGPDIS